MTVFHWVRSFVIAISVAMVLAVGTFGFGLDHSWAQASTMQLLGKPPIQVATTMNRVQAITKDLEGKAQEAIGNMTGDPKNQIMGKAKQVEGRVLQNVEDVRDKTRLKQMTKTVTKSLKNDLQDMKRK